MPIPACAEENANIEHGTFNVEGWMLDVRCLVAAWLILSPDTHCDTLTAHQWETRI